MPSLAAALGSQRQRPAAARLALAKVRYGPMVAACRNGICCPWFRRGACFFLHEGACAVDHELPAVHNLEAAKELMALRTTVWRLRLAIAKLLGKGAPAPMLVPIPHLHGDLAAPAAPAPDLQLQRAHLPRDHVQATAATCFRIPTRNSFDALDDDGDQSSFDLPPLFGDTADEQSEESSDESTSLSGSATPSATSRASAFRVQVPARTVKPPTSHTPCAVAKHIGNGKGRTFSADLVLPARALHRLPLPRHERAPGGAVLPLLRGSRPSSASAELPPAARPLLRARGAGNAVLPQRRGSRSSSTSAELPHAERASTLASASTPTPLRYEEWVADHVKRAAMSDGPALIPVALRGTLYRLYADTFS